MAGDLSRDGRFAAFDTGGPCPPVETGWRGAYIGPSLVPELKRSGHAEALLPEAGHREP